MKRTYRLRTEHWKPVKGYEGLYEWCGKTGQVRSVDRYVKKWDGERIVKGQILKPNKRGKYYVVSLSRNSKKEYFSLHRLIATNGISNPDNKPEVDHIDTDTTNNCVWNLRWVTHKENRNNPNSLKNYSKSKSKPVNQWSLNHKLVKVWSSMTEVFNETGFSISLISQCCSGKRLTGYGYIWSYA